jgi:serine/threonine protein kinase
MRCKKKMLNGKQCQRSIVTKSKYCWQHQTKKRLKQRGGGPGGPTLNCKPSAAWGTDWQCEDEAFKAPKCVDENHTTNEYYECPKEGGNCKKKIDKVAKTANMKVCKNMELKPIEETPKPHYQETNILGKGAFGEVVSGNFNGKTIAIKKISIRNPEIDEIKNEAKILRYLKSNCQEYFTCFVNFHKDAQYYYIVMEFIGNYKGLDKYQHDEINFILLRNICRNLLLGLQSLHNLRVIHNDIKPDNIMYNSATQQIKYIDFGLACFETSCQVKITPPLEYLSPERLANFEQGDYFYKSNKADNDILKRGDIWAVMMICWELLSNKKNFVKIKRKIYNQIVDNLDPKIDYCKHNDPNYIQQVKQFIGDDVNHIKGFNIYIQKLNKIPKKPHGTTREEYYEHKYKIVNDILYTFYDVMDLYYKAKRPFFGKYISIDEGGFISVGINYNIEDPKVRIENLVEALNKLPKYSH